MNEIWDTLYQRARDVAHPHEVSEHIYVASVGAALLTKNGTIYTGVCVDTSCSLGLCAERNALTTMFTHGEYEVEKVCAVYQDGSVMPPCGACREFMMQLPHGAEIEVLLSREGKTARLGDLMPEYPY